MKTLFNIILFLWQLPQNLVGLFMLLFKEDKKVAQRDYSVCYRWSLEGGISLGYFTFVSRNLEIKECHVMHEIDGHTVQSKILGPLYLLIIGLPSIMWAWLRRYNLNKFPNYYSFYTEKWANYCAGIEAYDMTPSYSGRHIYELRKKNVK